ncbi:hypothetical protein B9Z55_025100 [Caenorhabditis nigoni]|uniref:Uncharacterized protein n=1 Tax=Caenorhabditis nigoni TaxID=1611254 RepID=A0A2G5SX37_9PELO|nr:hypothetical protein B9Z55_025100 [Caenorhabditis nigoni]
MSVPSFDAFAYGITNSDRIGKDELAKLEATKFSKIKDMEINMKSIIQILVVIENLENELNVTTSKFFRIPDQYKKFVSEIQERYFPTSKPLTTSDLLKFSEIENIGKLISTHSIKLKYILNLDRFRNSLSLKGSFTEIPRLNGSTFTVWHHLHSVASVTSNMMLEKIPLHIFVLVLMFPLQDFFTKTSAADFKKIIGYHGRDPLPDDLSQFKKKKSEFETSSVSLTKNLRIPIRFPAMIQLVLLDNIDSFNSRETILSHLKFRFMDGHFAIGNKEKINTVLDADYTAHYENEFRLCSKSLAQVRIDLTKACEESAKQLDFYDASDRKEMEQCVKLYYDVGFGNLAKWEVAVNILKDLFDSNSAMDSPVDSSRDVAATWNSNHSLDLDSGGNSVSNSPTNLNSVPSKSYLPAHMTRQKRNIFVKSYSTGQMFNRRLNKRIIPKSSNADFNTGSSFMNLNEHSSSSSRLNINPPLDLSPPSNVDPFSPPYMQSPPSISFEPQTPVMYLMPKNSDAPVYGLVPDGLAPEGWRNDPAWQQNVYKVGGTIEYEGNDYQMATTFTEL